MGNLLMDWKAVGKKESFFTIVGTWCSVAFFPTVGFHLIPPPNITLSECYLGTQTGGGSFFFTWKTKGKHGGRAFFVLEIGPRGGLWNPQAHYTQGCHLTGPCRAAYPFRKSAANREVLKLIRGGGFGIIILPPQVSLTVSFKSPKKLSQPQNYGVIRICCIVVTMKGKVTRESPSWAPGASRQGVVDVMKSTTPDKLNSAMQLHAYQHQPCGRYPACQDLAWHVPAGHHQDCKA